MWVAHEQYEQIWLERQRDAQREAERMQWVKLAQAARREQGQTARLPQVASRIWQAAAERLRLQPQAEPCCAPAE